MSHPSHAPALERALAALKTGLGDNLHSCCLYGSAVRGNATEGVSDLNLLIVLGESKPAAHDAIARALEGCNEIDPFILGRRGFARNARAFATKFASIRRHYRVLHGADPFADLTIDPTLERFLCEQAVRNLRLRLVYSFVTRAPHKHYDRFLVNSVTTIFVQFSEALRLEGVEAAAFCSHLLAAQPAAVCRAELNRCRFAVGTSGGSPSACRRDLRLSSC